MKHGETGRSRGFGFVTYKDPSCVQLVLSTGPHQLDGRTIDPKSCNAKNAQKGKRDAKSSNYPKIFLGGLPPNVNETVLREFFAKYGKVAEVVIMYDQEKKKTRGNGFRDVCRHEVYMDLTTFIWLGFGFLSFENEEAVNKVVAEHYVNISGKQVEVKRAEPREKPNASKNEVSTQQTNPAAQPQQQPVNPMSVTAAAPWWPPHGTPAPPLAAPPANGVPMPNGVMAPNSYPPGWGAHPAPTAYGPGGAWTAPPAYQSYQGWGAAYPYPPQGWAAQQGYAYGTGYPIAYPNYGTPSGPASAPPNVPPPATTGPAPTGAQVIASPPFAQAQGPLPPPPPPPIPPPAISTPMTPTPVVVSSNQPSQGTLQPGYAQDSANYGPIRVYSYSSSLQGQNESVANSSTSYGGSSQTSTGFARIPPPTQAYHPYQRR
ncbi:heterogeneous nuclear ribonucleoprotein 27C-like isoform X1 [Dinothrombium tinctorium]|uniref:Heterogeneous nuclear ribonucleoprotein 27C-like isoform X1 n=1 Tax=Dinothrombium tinctorium TaxID=1965070 RepID=A0A3S3RYP0_9ACAR|nr:heterogeneous nuclear ribonucleoprotein 27C-like isoform X1 [Dinothrombium tinctorium]